MESKTRLYLEALRDFEDNDLVIGRILAPSNGV